MLLIVPAHSFFPVGAMDIPRGAHSIPLRIPVTPGVERGDQVPFMW